MKRFSLQLFTRWKSRFRIRFLFNALVSLSLISCAGGAIHPEGERQERQAASKAGAVQSYQIPLEKRPLPRLETTATLALALEYAFLANGDLEAAWREWIAAIERIPQAGSLQDPRLNFTFLFDSKNLKSFSGILDSIRADAGQELPARGKRGERAEKALAESRSAGERFRAAKYRLQTRTVRAYVDVSLNQELIEITSESLRLLDQTYQIALHRYHGMSGEGLPELQKIEMETERMETEQRAMVLARRGYLEELNAALNRPAGSPFNAFIPPAIEDPILTDAELLEQAAKSNPELSSLAHEIEARDAASALARLESSPDYSVAGGVDANLTPMLSAGMSLPIYRDRIRAALAEAEAMRQAAESRLRAAKADTRGRVITAIVSLRDSRRITHDFNERILPKARELIDVQLSAYRGGGGDFLQILDTERLMIEFRKIVLRAGADRIKTLADLEEICGQDLFQIDSSPTSSISPTSQTSSISPDSSASSISSSTSSSASPPLP